ncbi:MAG: exo-alpha-sialidase [Clostridia bacterium]|nr:exo-alpha-sialidase [Clostridia bacterium]
MKIETRVIRSGWDGKRCIVHARCCRSPYGMIATAQYLDVAGSDLFSGILSSQSKDGGVTWTGFRPEEGLAPVLENGFVTVGCDATPMYHRASGKVILLGHTARYTKGGMTPAGGVRHTFWSVWDPESGSFSRMRFLKMPEGYECGGNGCGQSVEEENGDLLIPVYWEKPGDPCSRTAVLRCAFTGGELRLLEIGDPLSLAVPRGLGEGSLIRHGGLYHLTMRNDECALTAVSEDGLRFREMHFWRWDDGSLLQSYNTQQHWMEVRGDLYLVYTRRAETNDHVFRHRAPLFAARVEEGRLIRESEIVLTPERGARLGNFGAAPYGDGRAMVMAAEWMQPAGCEAYGSDNSVYLTVVG